jgi:lipopolysaccharide transport system permease protein
MEKVKAKDNSIITIKTKRYADLIFQKSRADLKAEAARGYLGVLWWIIEPTLYMGAFYIVFAQLLKIRDANYVKFLLCGFITWKWFASTIISTSNSLIANKGLMNQVYLPKLIFPLITITSNTIKFFIVFPLFMAFLLLMGETLTIVWLALPLVLFCQLLLIIACASLCSAIVPFFPDLRSILETMMLFLMFLSGIFYDIHKLSAKSQSIMLLNPMASLIDMYRAIMLRNEWPDFFVLICIIFSSILIFGVSVSIFKRFNRIFPKIIH